MNNLTDFNQKTSLFELIKNDNDFIVSNISENECHNLIKQWLFGLDLSNFLLDKKYLDISWYCVNDIIYDADSLWDDFNDYIDSL